MRVVWSPDYEVDIGPHVFPTRKYRLVRERLLAERALDAEAFVAPRPASAERLARVHSAAYLRKIRDGAFAAGEEALLEVPFSPALREAMVLCCGGTIECARRALADGVGVHLGAGSTTPSPTTARGSAC